MSGAREVLMSPHLARGSQSGLDFIVDQEDLVLVTNLAQRPVKLGAKMIVSAFSLDRFQDQTGDIVNVSFDSGPDLPHRLLLQRLDLLQISTLQGKPALRIDDSRPVELRKILGLTQI